ncbi:MAG: hypothetical protein JXX14_07960 [Deltaproteobacteria bacterium]|nr:hypothetical protein [Deltaproteobacteria bacterium]
MSSSATIGHHSSVSSIQFFTKDAKLVLKLLEKTVIRLGLQIRYEPIFQNGEPWQSDGGLCRLLEEKLIIVNSLAPAEQKCQVILAALRQQPPSPLIPPAVQHLIERQS